MIADNKRKLIPALILGLCMALFCLGNPATEAGAAPGAVQDGNFQVQTNYSYPVTVDMTHFDSTYGGEYGFTVQMASTEGEPFLTRPDEPYRIVDDYMGTGLYEKIYQIYTSSDFDLGNLTITIEKPQVPSLPDSVTGWRTETRSGCSYGGDSCTVTVDFIIITDELVEKNGEMVPWERTIPVSADISRHRASIQADYRDEHGAVSPVYQGTTMITVAPFIAASEDMGDIFNATFNLRVLKAPEKIRIINRLPYPEGEGWHPPLEPAPGVDLRLYFVWDTLAYYPGGAGDAGWKTSGADGWTSFTTSPGAGTEVFFDDLRVHADALYVALIPDIDAVARVFQYNSYPALKNFTGDLNVTVKDPHGRPLDDISVFVWGGHAGHAFTVQKTAEEGKADLEIGSSKAGSQTLEATLYPSVDLRWNLTQVIDNPRDIVLDHSAPLFISPELIMEQDFFDKWYTEIHGVWIELYDRADPEQVIAKSRPQSLAAEYMPPSIQRAEHRAYLSIDPSRLRSFSTQAQTQGTTFGLRVMVKVSDDGNVAARRLDRRSGTCAQGIPIADRLREVSYREPRKQGFTVGFVPLRTGAWSENPFSTREWGDIHNPRECLRQIEFARQFFPSGIDRFMSRFAEYFYIHPMSIRRLTLSRVFHELNRMQKRRQDNIDLIVGIVPPGFLGAAGLSMDGVTGAVLFDPSEAGRNQHIVIHEFLHTLGFEDMYPSDEVWSDIRKGWRPLSANGHDRRPFNNYEEYSGGRYHYGNQTRELLMYDQGIIPWPSRDEYTAFLDYATEPAATAAASPLASNGDDDVQNVLVISGEIVETWNFEEGPGKRVNLDPVFSYRGAVNRGSGETGYTVVIVDGEGNELERGYVAGPAGFQASIPLKPFDEEAGDLRFMVSLPDHQNKAAIEIRQNGDLLERYDYGESPPEVILTRPTAASLSGSFVVAWSASGEEGKRLYSSLMISADGGATWQPVTIETVHDGPGNYSHAMDADLLPSGDAYRFKVILSDGLRESEAVSAQSHTITGYDAAPKLALDEGDLAVTVTAEDREVSVFLVIRNEGEEELTVRFDGESFPSWVSPKAAEREIFLYGGREKLLRIALELPGEFPEEQPLLAELRLFSNDPDQEETEIPLVVNYADSRPAPEIVYVETRPEAISKGLWPLDTTFDITAFASAGNRRLEAEVTIELLGGAPVLNREPMTACNHEWGAYIFFWDPAAGETGLDQGEYGVKIFLRDPETGLERNPEDYDIIVMLGDNQAPVLTVNIVDQKPQWIINQDEEWNEYFLDNLEIGDELRISYTVSDPDGDDVTVRVVSNLPAQALQLVKSDGGGEISWTATSGAHYIYLIAEDTHRSTAQVRFGLNCYATEDDDPGDDPSPHLPPPPVLETESGTVDGDRVVIEGTAPPNSMIRVMVHGGQGTEPVTETGTADSDGRFSIEIPLAPGENKILVTSQTEVEPESLPAVIVITAPGGDGPPGGHPGLAQAIAILKVLTGQDVSPEALPPPEFLDGRPLGLHDAIGILRLIGN